ncbi:MAG: outer membrane beta-barrel protein [Clostridiales bacterium]|nr:outer membrane beta-barrel protein [Clostridiales bacterium]
MRLNKEVLVALAGWLLVVPAGRASTFGERLSLRLSPGGIMALGGYYNDTQTLGKIVNLGIGLNGGIRYKISDFVFIDACYAFNWLAVKKDQRPFDYKEQNPAFNLQTFSLNGTFFLTSGYMIEPYFTVGAGICPWRFSDGPLWGAAWPAPAKPQNSFSKTSLGLNVGLGVESYLFSKVSAFAEIKYFYIFARDVGKFGTDDFTEQDFLGFNIGLVYYFGKK